MRIPVSNCQLGRVYENKLGGYFVPLYIPYIMEGEYTIMTWIEFKNKYPEVFYENYFRTKKDNVQNQKIFP